MGMLEEMGVYLGLDEIEERENLLESAGGATGREAFYMVGQRPLNSKGGEKAYEASPGASHMHFVRNDGIGNFGFGPGGVFIEAPGKLESYELTDEYGDKKYNAGLLEMLIEGLDERRNAIEQTAEDLDLQDHIFPAMHESYSLFSNNCKDFVNNMDYLYRLAGGKYQ